MKPPICALCRKRFSPSSGGSTVSFKDYTSLPDGIVGHPKGLAWFCSDHIDLAEVHSHLSMAEALQIMRGGA